MGGYAAPPGGGEWSFGGQSGNTTTGANNSGYAGAVQAANPGTTSVAPSGSYGGSSAPAPSPSYSAPPSSGSSGSTIISNTPVSSGLTTSQQMALQNNPAVDVNNPNAVYFAIYGQPAPYVGEGGNLAPYLPANIPAAPPVQYSTPTPTTQAPTSYSINRPDYYDPSTLGDTQTQNLVKSGMTIEQALNKQAAEASNSRAATYYQNELQKSLGSNIALASEYHYQSNLTGLPQAPNPYANVADLSLYTLKGVQGKDASFSPTSYSTLNLPNNGMGIQDAAWNKALGINTQANFTSAIDVIASAKLSGDVGFYNTTNLQSYSSSEGVLSLARQQEIGLQVQASPFIGSNGWAINDNIVLPQPTQFGYGAGGFKPSYINDNLKAPSPIQGVVNTERVLGSYASAYDTQGNFSPSMTLLGAGVKLTEGQALMLDFGFKTSKSASEAFFSQQEGKNLPKPQTTITKPTGAFDLPFIGSTIIPGFSNLNAFFQPDIETKTSYIQTPVTISSDEKGFVYSGGKTPVSTSLPLTSGYDKLNEDIRTTLHLPDPTTEQFKNTMKAGEVYFALNPITMATTMPALIQNQVMPKVIDKASMLTYQDITPGYLSSYFSPEKIISPELKQSLIDTQNTNRVVTQFVAPFGEAALTDTYTSVYKEPIKAPAIYAISAAIPMIGGALKTTGVGEAVAASPKIAPLYAGASKLISGGLTAVYGVDVLQRTTGLTIGDFNTAMFGTNLQDGTGTKPTGFTGLYKTFEDKFPGLDKAGSAARGIVTTEIAPMSLGYVAGARISDIVSSKIYTYVNKVPEINRPGSFSYSSQEGYPTSSQIKSRDLKASIEAGIPTFTEGVVGKTSRITMNPSGEKLSRIPVGTQIGAEKGTINVYSGAEQNYLREGYVGQGASEIKGTFVSPTGYTYFSKVNPYSTSSFGMTDDIFGMMRQPTMFKMNVADNVNKIPENILHTQYNPKSQYGSLNDPMNPRSKAISDFMELPSTKAGEVYVGQYGKPEFQGMIKAGSEVASNKVIGYYKDQGVNVLVRDVKFTGKMSESYAAKYPAESAASIKMRTINPTEVQTPTRKFGVNSKGEVFENGVRVKSIETTKPNLDLGNKYTQPSTTGKTRSFDITSKGKIIEKSYSGIDVSSNPSKSKIPTSVGIVSLINPVRSTTSQSKQTQSYIKSESVSSKQSYSIKPSSIITSSITPSSIVPSSKITSGKITSNPPSSIVPSSKITSGKITSNPPSSIVPSSKLPPSYIPSSFITTKPSVISKPPSYPTSGKSSITSPPSTPSYPSSSKPPSSKIKPPVGFGGFDGSGKLMDSLNKRGTRFTEKFKYGFGIGGDIGIDNFDMKKRRVKK